MIESGCRLVFAAGEKGTSKRIGGNRLITGIPNLDGTVFVTSVSLDHRICGGTDESGGGAEMVFGQVIGRGGTEGDLGEKFIDLRAVDEFLKD